MRPRLVLGVFAIGWAFVLALAVDGAALAAAAEPLRVWHGLGGETSQWAQAVIAAPGEGGGLSVAWQADVDIEAAIFRQEEAAAAPDALIVPSNLTGLQRELGLSAVPPQLLASLTASAASSVQQSTAYYGIPLFASDTLALYRNLDLAPQAPTSLAAALQQGRVAWPGTVPFYFLPLLIASGGFSQVGETFTIKPEGMSAALAWLARLRGTRREDCGLECAAHEFQRGGAAYWVGTMAERRQTRAILGDRLVMERLPPLRNSEAPLRGLVGTYALVFPNHSLEGPRRRDLLRLGAALLAGPAQRLLFQMTGRPPVVRTVLRDVGRTASAEDALALAITQDALPLPHSRATAALWAAMRKVLRTIWSGQQIPAAPTLMRLIEEYDARLVWGGG